MSCKLINVFLWIIALCPALLRSQENPCANPQSPRFGLFIAAEVPTEKSADYLKRSYNISKRLHGGRSDPCCHGMIHGVCIVHDVDQILLGSVSKVAL